MSKYLSFQQIIHTGKTKRYEVISNTSGCVLGRIWWYSTLRQYVFQPAFERIWNKDCLKDIEDCLQQLMNERKNV